MMMTVLMVMILMVMAMLMVLLLIRMTMRMRMRMRTRMMKMRRMRMRRMRMGRIRMRRTRRMRMGRMRMGRMRRMRMSMRMGMGMRMMIMMTIVAIVVISIYAGVLCCIASILGSISPVRFLRNKSWPGFDFKDPKPDASAVLCGGQVPRNAMILPFDKRSLPYLNEVSVRAAFEGKWLQAPTSQLCCDPV